MAVDPEILDQLRAAIDDATSWEDVGGRLRASDPDSEDDRLRPFIFAFSYPLIERASDRRARAGGPFGAMIAGDGWRFPPAVADIEDADVEAWAHGYDEIDDPVIQARLGDLLWERRAQPRPDVRARGACDALLELAGMESWRVMERSRLLSRALELARAVGDDERRDRAVESMIAFVEADLASDDGGPGASLMPLRSIVDLSAEERPQGLDELLVQVGTKYGADPYIADNVAELRARLLSAEERQALRQDQVARWREEAQKGDAILRVARLEQALELARAFGLRDEADELRRELGTIHPDDLDLKTISAEVEIPREEVDRFMALFRDAPSWQEGLLRLAAQPPPGGSPEELATQVDEMMAEYPVQYLFTKVVVGPESAGAIFRASDAESHKRLALSEERSRAATMWGIFAADALDSIGEAFERPPKEALTEFFTTDLIDEEVAERMARALELYWDAQPDESAHILVPRIERVLREMARRVGVPVFREPVGDKTGGVEGLGARLQDIKGAFTDDQGWHAYLVVLLADPLGLNLRNSISHGLIGRVDRHNAALLLQAACLLRSLGLVSPQSPPTPPSGAGPTPSAGSSEGALPG